MRAARRQLQNDEEEYRRAKDYYIKVFKQEYEQQYDLTDPRLDHNLEIKEYDILDSEAESEDGVITEEV